MSLHQTHILLNIAVADLTIPFTERLSEIIILLLKLKTNLRKSSPKDGMLKFTNISDILLDLGKLSIFYSMAIIVGRLYFLHDSNGAVKPQ